VIKDTTEIYVTAIVLWYYKAGWPLKDTIICYLKISDRSRILIDTH